MRDVSLASRSFFSAKDNMILLISFQNAVGHRSKNMEKNIKKTKNYQLLIISSSACINKNWAQFIQEHETELKSKPPARKRPAPQATTWTKKS